VQNGRLKVTANTAAEVERSQGALTKHEKQLGLLHVTKARRRKPQ